jgi:hypothetical protein
VHASSERDYLQEALQVLQLVRSADVPAPRQPWFPAPRSHGHGGVGL